MATQFVNQINFNIPEDKEHTLNYRTKITYGNEIDNNSAIIHSLIPKKERDSIIQHLDKANWLPVSYTGMSGNYTEGDPIGSYRASNYTPEYANVLWERIKNYIPKYRYFNENSPTDYDNHEVWEAIGVSPLLRFIKYEDGGKLVVHYDAPYVENEDTRTLQSFVIYIYHDNELVGGATRYLHDKQANIPVKDRDLSDQIRFANKDEVRYNFLPEDGTGVIFDHRLLHDAQEVKGKGRKIIIRTDIMYRKVK